jgi:hypothetical protein
MKYAEAASGKVTCFVDAAPRAGAFARLELPALLKNEKITHINGLARANLNRAERQLPGGAFHAVEQSAFERYDLKSREGLPQEPTAQKSQTPPAGPTRSNHPARRPLSRDKAGEPPPRDDRDNDRGLSR